MSELSLFFGSAVGIVLVGIMTFVAARMIMIRSIRIAAFAFVSGFAIARFSGNGSTFQGAGAALATLAGAALGLGILYWWWFKRGQSVGIDG